MVICLRGPCPVATAELITVPYPPLAVAPSGTQVSLEFRAPNHRPVVNDYTLYPGVNTITYSLAVERPGPPDSAKLDFQGLPGGTSVECIGGPCPDSKVHPANNFPEVKLKNDDETLLLRFKAAGYRTSINSFKLKRGVNTLLLVLEPETGARDK